MYIYYTVYMYVNVDVYDMYVMVRILRLNHHIMFFV